MLYFTSDFHFGHENILRYCNRPFHSVMEMDEMLINNYNSQIDNDDTVYILGDFAFNNVIEYSSRLNGIKYLIPGSHDKFKYKENYGELMILDPIFEIPISGLIDEYDNNRLIVLCHYSMRSWNKSHYGSYHLFGHHHGNLNSYGLSFDIGVDTNNYFPYSLNQIETKMKTLKPIIDYRKKEN